MARVFQTGFEFPGTGTPGSGASAGISTISSANSLLLGLPLTTSGGIVIKNHSSATILPHKSLTNLGGDCFYSVSNTVTITTPVLLSEGTIAFAYKPITDASYGFDVGLYSGASLIGHIKHSGGVVQFLVGNAAIASASVGVSIDNSVWSWVVIDFKIHTTSGYMKVYISSVSGLSTPIINYSWAGGATYGAYKVSSVSFARVSLVGGSSATYYMDDLCINSKSISFISSSGALSAGNTITGGTSGATATVSYIENSDATYGVSGSGRITVTDISGKFVDTETISSASGWSGEIQFAGGDHDGFDFNSGLIGESYIVGLSLSADRSVEMTGSDGDQVDNYSLLNEQLADDTTYVQALGVSTALDLYELENITQNASVISAISINSRLKKAGEINYAIPAINIGGTTQYPAAPIDITSNVSYKKKNIVIDVNTATNDPFSKQNINDMAIGIRFK